MTPELRAKVISEWRGCRETYSPPDRTCVVGDTLEKVMKQLGLQERLTEAQILSAWREIVGEWFAMHTFPERIRDRVLFVRVVQSSVHCELARNWKPEIIRKLKERIGAGRVREIKFRVG